LWVVEGCIEVILPEQLPVDEAEKLKVGETTEEQY
jgi:hypothetical protein